MQDWAGRECGPITEERLVRAVEVLADFVKQHGPAYGSLFETFEKQLEAFRRRQEDLGGISGPSSLLSAAKAA
jgi:hypothetical protein